MNSEFQPHIINKQFLEGSPDLPEFFLHKRHVFIMSSSGRPVYVRYGDEIKSSIFLATLNAILQKFLIFFSEDKEQQHVFRIDHYKVKLFVLKRNQLFLIASTTKEESEYVINKMLDFLNCQLISIVTDNVNQQLANKPNYDPSNLLSGSKNLLSLAIKNGVNSPCISFNAICPLPMNATMRSYIHGSLKEIKNSNLLITILLTETVIIDILKEKHIDLKTTDILLIQNLIQGQTQLRKSENWIPVCLPGLSALGFVYAYIHFFYQNIAIMMITDDQSHDMFFQLKELSNDLIEKFKLNNMLNNLQQCLNNFPLIPRCMDQPSSIKHFIARHSMNQIFVPCYQPFGKNPVPFKNYLHKYGELYKMYLIYSQKSKENFFYWSSDGFGLTQYHELVVRYDVLCIQNQIMFCFDQLLDFNQKLFKNEELNNYFILKQQ